jgi:hypothetical protein
MVGRDHEAARVARLGPADRRAHRFMIAPCPDRPRGPHFIGPESRADDLGPFGKA